MLKENENAEWYEVPDAKYMVFEVPRHDLAHLRCQQQRKLMSNGSTKLHQDLWSSCLCLQNGGGASDTAFLRSPAAEDVEVRLGRSQMRSSFGSKTQLAGA